jgi:membrane-anchored mycosin MYCP
VSELLSAMPISEARAHLPRHAITVLSSAAIMTMLAAAALMPASPAWAASLAPLRASRPAAAVRLPQAPPLSQGQWYFSAWDIQTKVWPLSTGAGVTVAVLDAGVQANLPDLQGVVVQGGDTGGNSTDGMVDSYDATGHGTAMAALIAGQGVDGGPVGVAPSAKILPVDVSGPVGGIDGDDATIAAGIRYAVDHGAQVINMSLAGVTASASGCDTGLQEAVAYALQHNVVVVAAAGDAETSGNPAEEPASCAGVLAVGAVNPDLTLWSGSEQQPYVTVSAPGNQVGLLGSNGTYYPDGWGTSCSAALVSGAVALMRSKYPSMPWYQVVQRLVNTALPEGSPQPNQSFGYGIVQIPGALNVAEYPVSATAPNPVYDDYQTWLTTQQVLHPARPKAHPSAQEAGRASTQGHGFAGSAGLTTVIAVAAAAAVAGLIVGVWRVRRRSVKAR